MGFDFVSARARIDFELVGKFQVSDGQSNGIVGQFIGYVTDCKLHEIVMGLGNY